MKKNICPFCGTDMGWNIAEIMQHQTDCISTQNSMGIRAYLPDYQNQETTAETVKIYPNGIPGFFEED